MGLDAIVEALSCPVCASGMRLASGSLVCSNSHSFDLARHGYANLLSGGARPSTADTPAMVAARSAFLGAGHYAPLIDAVADAVAAPIECVPGHILDIGGGVGTYLAAVLDRLPGRAGVCVDLSKAACKVAAKRLPQTGVVVADVWHGLPLRDHCIAAILDVFAPRNASEFRRVLSPDGVLVVVTPTSSHLHELVETLDLITVDPDKDRRLDSALGGMFRRVESHAVSAPLALSREEVVACVQMSPSASHVDIGDLAERVRGLSEPFHTTLSARVGVYRPCGGVTP